MALIMCTECGNEVSDRAVECPCCGCPVSDILLDIEENKMFEDQGTEQVSTWLLSVLSFIFPVLGFVFGSAYIASDNEDYAMHLIRISTISLVICIISIIIIISKTRM